MDIERLAEVLNEKFDKVHKKIDEKADQLHNRITEAGKEQTAALHEVTDDQNEKIADLREELRVSLAKPCKDVAAHETKYHGSSKRLDRQPAVASEGNGRLSNGKVVAIITGLVAAVGGLVGLAASLVKLLNK